MFTRLHRFINHKSTKIRKLLVKSTCTKVGLFSLYNILMWLAKVVYGVAFKWRYQHGCHALRGPWIFHKAIGLLGSKIVMGKHPLAIQSTIAFAFLLQWVRVKLGNWPKSSRAFKKSTLTSYKLCFVLFTVRTKAKLSDFISMNSSFFPFYRVLLGTFSCGPSYSMTCTWNCCYSPCQKASILPLPSLHSNVYPTVDILLS